MVDPHAKELRMIQFWHSLSANVEQFLTVCREKTFSPGEGCRAGWGRWEPAWVQDGNGTKDRPEPSCGCGWFNRPWAFRRAAGKILGVVEFLGMHRAARSELLGMMAAIGIQMGCSSRGSRRRRLSSQGRADPAASGLHRRGDLWHRHAGQLHVLQSGLRRHCWGMRVPTTCLPGTCTTSCTTPKPDGAPYPEEECHIYQAFRRGEARRWTTRSSGDRTGPASPPSISRIQSSRGTTSSAPW